MGDLGILSNGSWEWNFGFNWMILNDVDALLLGEFMQILWDVKSNIQEALIGGGINIDFRSIIVIRGFLSLAIWGILWIL